MLLFRLRRSMVHLVCLFMKTPLLALLQDNCLDLLRCAFLRKLSGCVRNITAFYEYLLCVRNLSLLIVRRFDDDAAQRVSLCRRMWLLSPKAEAQTRPHTAQADPCHVVVGCGWLRC